MARPLATRIVVQGTLEAVTPLQVGGAGPGDTVDIAFTRDGLGRHYIPGTGLAGAMRAWCERRFDETLVQQVWGFQNGDQGHASHVVVDDAVVSIPGGMPEVWPGVGIDRYTGTAASQILYSREILPRGTQIPLTLEVEDGNQEPEGMLRHLLEAMSQGIYLGGGKTRGTGRVRLAEGVEIQRQDWTGKKGVRKALEQGGDKVKLEDLPEVPEPGKLDIHAIDIAWKAVDPVMVAAGYDGITVDILPLVSAVSDHQVALVLPGSAIKGALRSAAERIMRTLLDIDLTESDKFLDQVKVPLVDELFGEALTADGAGRAGAVTVDTCYSQDRIDRDLWESITLATDDAKLRCLLDCTGLDIDQAYHVKIDRWTGGAFDGALYSALEPRVAWEPIRLVYDRERLDPDLQGPATVLLALTLEELKEGRIPLGFGVNRGYGGVAVREVKGAPWEVDLGGLDREKRSEYLEEEAKEAREAEKREEQEVGA